MRESDVDPCLAIILANPLWAHYEITVESARDKFAGVFEGLTEALVAEDEGLVLGFVVYCLRGTLYYSGYIRSVGVAPNAQSKRVGTSLMDAAELEIFRHGPNIFLLVSAFNVDAQRFYERRGYCRVGELPHLVRRGITEILYWKTLGPINEADSQNQ